LPPPTWPITRPRSSSRKSASLSQCEFGEAWARLRELARRLGRDGLVTERRELFFDGLVRTERERRRERAARTVGVAGLLEDDAEVVERHRFGLLVDRDEQRLVVGGARELVVARVHRRPAELGERALIRGKRDERCLELGNRIGPLEELLLGPPGLHVPAVIRELLLGRRRLRCVRGGIARRRSRFGRRGGCRRRLLLRATTERDQHDDCTHDVRVSTWALRSP
jgi:hypothetical protein